mmetsp:Transcript_27761/g.81599  ORF Transcript_27761/g.81599 Transcript_27761/m.81599 type:complete len:107 (-) Transcript_27761:339-659(-)
MAAAAAPMADAAPREPPPLPAGVINVWINQGQTGYGIYFKQLPTGDGMIVSKLDAGSEAQKAGVQPGDHLVMVDDVDVRYEPHQETLNRVRRLKACKMTFVPTSSF